MKALLIAALLALSPAPALAQSSSDNSLKSLVEKSSEVCPPLLLGKVDIDKLSLTAKEKAEITILCGVYLQGFKDGMEASETAKNVHQS